MKALELEPYTVEEAARCAGQGSYIKPQKRKIETQPSKEEYTDGKRIKIEIVKSKEENKMQD